MRKFSISLTIIVFLSGSLIAQSDFRPGYIIYNNGDTLTGLIDYKGNQANARKCVFKLSKDDQEEKFTPEDIKAYRFIDSKYYVSKKILTEDSIETQLFLEYLIDGIVDIYYYLSPSGDNYFIDPGNNQLILLKDNEEKVVVDEKIYASDVKRYKGVLKYIFSKSLKVSREVDDIALDHKSLIRIAKEYHEAVCTDKECIVFEKKLPSLKWQLGLVAGMSIDLAKLNGVPHPEYSYLIGSDFNVSAYPLIGLNFKINLPFLNERMNLLYSPELGYVKFETNNLMYLKGNPVIMHVHMSKYRFANTLFLNYELPLKEIKPFITTGIRISSNLKSDYTLMSSNLGNPSYTQEYPMSEYAKTDYFAILGCGVAFIFRQAGTISLDCLYIRDIRDMASVILEDGFSFRVGYLF